MNLNIKTKEFNELTVFRVTDAVNFLWSEWDDASVIYDIRSGHTQVLNDTAREILDLFEDGPKSFKGLFKEFENIIEAELDSDLQIKIVETVAEFDNMGLIEPE